MMRTLLTILLIGLLSRFCPAASSPVDVQHSTVTIRVFKSGLFSGLAHNHEIAAPLSSGTIDLTTLSVEVHFAAQNLSVLDPEASPGDRAKVQETMLSDKVLDVERFPQITFVSRSVKSAEGNVYMVEGDLTLHGVTHPLALTVSLTNGHYMGSVKLKQTAFGITPISLFGGSVKVKDIIEINLDILLQPK